MLTSVVLLHIFGPPKAWKTNRQSARMQDRKIATYIEGCIQSSSRNEDRFRSISGCYAWQTELTGTDFCHKTAPAMELTHRKNTITSSYDSSRIASIGCMNIFSIPDPSLWPDTRPVNVPDGQTHWPPPSTDRCAATSNWCLISDGQRHWLHKIEIIIIRISH